VTAPRKQGAGKTNSVRNEYGNNDSWGNKIWNRRVKVPNYWGEGAGKKVT